MTEATNWVLVNAIQPECRICSAKERAEIPHFQGKQKIELGL